MTPRRSGEIPPPMMMEFQAYVDNIGNIGTFSSALLAIAAVRQTIAKSGRADEHGFVLFEDEIIFEVGSPSDD